MLEGDEPGDDDNSEQVVGTASATRACDDDNSEQEGVNGAVTATVTEALDLETSTEISSWTFDRKEKKFQLILPSNSEDQLSILVSFVSQKDPNFAFLLPTESC